MSEVKINSKDYWDMRFDTDWENYGGSSQTEFFAKIAVKMFPNWFVRETRAERYSVCDMGCAFGNGVDVLSKYLGVTASGMDFSEEAIKKAQITYPQYEFMREDLKNVKGSKQYDIVYCSNVLEHFPDPWEIFDNLTKLSNHYIVLLVPFREKLAIEEHEYKFDSNIIPIKREEFQLIYTDTLNGADIENTYYPDQQILLIYSKKKEDKDLISLSDIANGISKSDGIDLISEAKDLSEKLKNSADENKLLQHQINDYKIQIESISENTEKLNKEIEISKLRERDLKDQIEEYEKTVENLKEQLTQQSKEYDKTEESLKNDLVQLNNTLAENELKINNAIIQCKNMTNSRLFKFVHLTNRFIYQGIKGDKLERKKFRKWIRSKLHGGGDADRRYNPLFSITEKLESNIKTETITSPQKDFYIDSENSLNTYLKLEKKRITKALKKGKSKKTLEIKNIINSRNFKGILIYPHVVYWEPLQTPQQLLRSFAKQGWLCFFCEHPDKKDIYREIEHNLFVVHETDLLLAIEDTQVTVMLTWLGSLPFIEQIKNKTIWYHILDQLDIFPYYNEYYLDVHYNVIQKSEFVSYVAKPLVKYTANREDSIYLPNGTNPEELLNQHEGYIPEDMINIINKGNKIIGYYGYLAEWMDYELVAEVAKERPDYEFVFIGKAIHDTSLINNISNIHLLGLKEYKDLSDYAKFFDVATIPFMINDMMNCVSPIKFYEYCALGLPVITSNMKEIQPYVCECVSCFNNKDEYIYYLDKFVQDDIKQLARRTAPIIANNNTWLSRVKTMIEHFERNQQTILSNDYKYCDIIILSVIDFDFRYQRPQHIAAQFAKNGHRVFYINANHFKESSITELEENLYIVNFKNDEYPAIHLTDWSKQTNKLYKLFDKLLYDYCIRDAVTVVDYPNWIYGAEYLRKKYGFKMITDYMDDYTGFLNPAEKLVGANCVKLLKSSDLVIASSQFLYDIAKKYNNNISIVRNGTEFEHFYQAANYKKKYGRKVIGYYGAVAQWFDIDKVCYIADNLKECDVVIIGEVTEGINKLQKCSNIKLLGEMPYNELPKHLACFDVCLIPFDTSTDLIKATNPVKFYEYLSAGKKIVATEIPELEPYKDKYVYMSNDNEQFLNYVRLCLNGSDTLANFEGCVEFGKENDWQKRYEAFASICLSAVPKVSIIVLTYNNLKLNKYCINSILNKTAYPNYELIIVDNMSTDGTREYLNELDKKNIPDVKVILNNKNSGFAGGNNIGIKSSEGDYVLLLNNDTIVTRGWLTSLVKHLENDEKLGMCGPVTNSIGNEAKIKVNYNSMDTLESFAFNYTWENIGKQYTDPNVLAFFCTLIKKEVINKCGMLDEEYGVGMFEDDDYAEAVKSAGYGLVIAEDSFIHHAEGASFKKIEEEKFNSIFEKNKERYEKKWNKRWKAHKYREGVTWDTNNNDILKRT